MSEQEEENGGTSSGKPNAWWAKIREEQLEEQQGDGYGGAYRGVKPAPHGGSVTVHAEDTIGAETTCWCGQPLGHSWPGKTVGAKHPKVGTMSNPGVAPDILDRRDLRAFHRRLQDFILVCISDDGLRYRQTKNGVILYPPDGSTPITVHARNTDRQIRQLQKWYLEHVYVEPKDEKVEEKVDEEALRRLAEATNDPVEHPATEPKAEPEKAPEPEPFRPTEKVSDGPMRKQEPVSPNEEWVPLMREKEGPSEFFVTNGTQIRCIRDECRGTDHEYIESVRSQGGHIRMYHTDTETLHGPDAKARAVATSRAIRQQRQKVMDAVEILIEAVGWEPPKPENEAALADWQHKYEAMEARALAAEKKAEELDAKLALIREATGL